MTWLLYKHGIQWAYFVGPGTCEAAPCGDAGGKTVTADVQNPLPGFTSVATTGQLDNIRPNTEFFQAAQEGNLPAVSWVMPTIGVGEHPPDSIAAGQAWVTKVVNAVMTGPPDQWLHTAIFITWDDWGGFYDHVKPPVVDENGWGLRVPDIMIGPFVKRGVSPSAADVRRVPEAGGGPLPRERPHRPEDRRLAGLATDRAGGRADPRRPREGLRLLTRPDPAVGAGPLALEALTTHLGRERPARADRRSSIRWGTDAADPVGAP